MAELRAPGASRVVTRPENLCRHCRCGSQQPTIGGDVEREGCVDAHLVLVHGFWSSPATWDRLISRLRDDPSLAGLRIHAFGYESPKLRWPGSPVRIPDYDDIAQSLPAYLAAHAPGTAPVAIVTHSQGGLILQRFLAWMLTEGRGRELPRIRLAVMLSCPNEGSEYLRSIRAAVGFGHHPQASQLDVLGREVGEARRIVLRQVVSAAAIDDRHCPIRVFVYSGRSDNVVRRESAQSVFPSAEVLPGDHFSILDPDAPGNLTEPTLRRHLLETLTSSSPAGDRPAAGHSAAGNAVLSLGSTPESKYFVRMDGPMGVQVGDGLARVDGTDHYVADKELAADAIFQVSRSAIALGLGRAARELESLARNLRSETVGVIVLGRFKNGKSTLANALLADTTRPVNLGVPGPLFVDYLPATAVITGVKYSEDPYIKAWDFDGTLEDWPLDRYMSHSGLGSEASSKIREFEMGFPARLCLPGVILYDSPGLDEDPRRTWVTQRAVQKSDIAVVVYRSDSLMGQHEVEQVGALTAAIGRHALTVINMWQDSPTDHRFRAYVWNRYVRERFPGVQAWAGQDLRSYDIYFVNAARARNARYFDEESGAEASGLVSFEQRLRSILAEEFRLRIDRLISRADDVARTCPFTGCGELVSADGGEWR